ncbi:hypothetical protein ACOMHN_030940 [Nucella lapillus]
MAAKTGPGSTVSSLTDYSLDRSNTRASFLVRDHSTLSSHVDSTHYQEKLQGWSTVFSDNPFVAPRPCTSFNAVRTRHANTAAEVDRELSFLRSNKSAFPEKPRELCDPLEGLMPSSGRLVSQRKYYVLPSIGVTSDLVLRRQHTSLDTLNQLDYSRDQLEDDAEFFSELIELKRESSLSASPNPQRGSAHPLPPIQAPKQVVRPRTNIAELDEDLALTSARQSLSGVSDVSDVEAFRARTPNPDYAGTSPRKLSVGSDSAFVQEESKSRPQSLECEDVEKSVPVLNVVFPEKESCLHRC